MSDSQRDARIKSAIREMGSEWYQITSAIKSIMSSGATSATISTGDGSKSYTHLDLDKLFARRTWLGEQISGLRRQLKGRGGHNITHRMVARD